MKYAHITELYCYLLLQQNQADIIGKELKIWDKTTKKDKRSIIVTSITPNTELLKFYIHGFYSSGDKTRFCLVYDSASRFWYKIL